MSITTPAPREIQQWLKALEAARAANNQEQYREAAEWLEAHNILYSTRQASASARNNVNRRKSLGSGAHSATIEQGRLTLWWKPGRSSGDRRGEHAYMFTQEETRDLLAFLLERCNEIDE